MLTYVLAVLGACANATSSVLQRKANRQVPGGENLTWRLIRSLLHKPVWFGGILAITAGFLLQAAALDSGQLATVEPILVLELPMTLILASRVFGQRMRVREWGATLAMTAGLAGVLFFLAPAAGRSGGVRWYAWLAGIAVNLCVTAFMVAWARTRPASGGKAGGHRDPRPGLRRAALLGIAGGSAFGMTAALIKGMTQTLAGGVSGVMTSWQIYGMVAAGLFGMFLTQSAMNAGPLVAAQPGLTLSDPVVSVLWGVLVFGERVRGGWFAGAAALCAVVITVAVVALARSPLLSGDGRESQAA